MQWGPWSPQYPKNGRQQRKPKETGNRGKEGGRKKEESLVPSYDSSTTSSAQQSSAGGVEAQFMKEFMDLAKETKMPIPERLQRLMPDGTKDAIRDQQKRLNRHRNVVNKIESRKKALEVDKEKWSHWLQEMKDAIVNQKKSFEENQKRLLQELEDLEKEELKLRNQDPMDEEMETAPEEEVEELVEGLLQDAGVEEPRPNGAADGEKAQSAKVAADLKTAVEKIQQRLERQYQEKWEERQKDLEKQWKQEQMASLVDVSDGEGPPAPANPPAALGQTTVRNAAAPFGVQRLKSTAVSSPYGRVKESKEEALARAMAERVEKDRETKKKQEKEAG